MSSLKLSQIVETSPSCLKNRLKYANKSEAKAITVESDRAIVEGGLRPAIIPELANCRLVLLAVESSRYELPPADSTRSYDAAFAISRKRRNTANDEQAASTMWHHIVCATS